MRYRKHFIPLESDPGLFTHLIHRLGAKQSIAFHDVLSLDEPELLAFVPRPALAVVLVFPTSAQYKAEITKQDKSRADYTQSGNDETVVWFRQSINNACGFYAVLHAVSNGRAREFLVPGSHLAQLIESCLPLDPTSRAVALENDAELDSVYHQVALQGQSEVPANPEDEVDFHYVCFVKSHKDNHLYLLDGDRKGPVDCGVFSGEDILSKAGLEIIKAFISRVARGLGFSLLALGPSASNDGS